MVDQRFDDVLETRLLALANAVAFPPAPDLAPAIARAITTRRRTAPRWRPLARAAVVSAVLVLAAAATVLVASPRAREAVADRLGIGGIRIEYVSSTPTPARSAASRPPARRLASPRSVAR